MKHELDVKIDVVENIIIPYTSDPNPTRSPHWVHSSFHTLMLYGCFCTYMSEYIQYLPLMLSTIFAICTALNKGLQKRLDIKAPVHPYKNIRSPRGRS